MRMASRAAGAVLAFIACPTFIIAGDPIPTIHLANVSTRLAVGTGNNVVIIGFIITGTQPKRVIVRGLGPLLPVSENLADPILELHGSPGGAVVNDNWRDTQESELKAAIPPTNDYESAIVKSLTPGNYTAVLAGKGGTTGVGLLEVYDLDLMVDSKLANISARGFVGQDDDVLIGGTIVLGSGTTPVVFRAIGPSLSGAPFSIANALEDPTLELHNGQGSVVATNDNWQESQDGGASIPANLRPADPREAVILYQLSPGAYTAVVRGKDNKTGIGLIEAYQIN